MRHPLSDPYRAGRERLLELGRALSDDRAATRSTACPAWSVKDLYAHLAGVSSDILSGDTDNAATAAWADGHVVDRTDRSLAEILDEWERDGAEVSNLVESAGDAFPPELFIDQWTHEWDIRAALGTEAATAPDASVIAHLLDRFADGISRDAESRDLDRLTVVVGGGPPDGATIEVGTGPAAGELALSTFEFGRIAMGRRSRRQLAELDWPVRAIDDYVDVIVRWSVNDFDVVDPVLDPDPDRSDDTAA